MVQKWNPNAPGFVGDDNLYGIGIRVGYYTQAISIWVANFYVRHEAPYLHTLTTLFLVALFIGLCVICINPTDNYAVEPFMLTSIAYYTLSTGLWDPSAPYLLPWEVEFRKQLVIKLIWLAFQGFDAWYWWVGVWKMKPSDGPWGTVIFYPYVGNTPLFESDEWISTAAKVINILIAVILLLSIARLCSYTLQQHRVNHAITVERLKLLTGRWLRAQNDRVARNSNWIVRDLDESTPTSATSVDEKKNFTANTAVSTNDGDETSMECKEHSSSGESSASSQHESDHPPPYRRPTRTGTGLMKLGLWRRTSNRDIDLSQPPPKYILYEPTFEDITAAIVFLKSTTECEPTKSPWYITILRLWLAIPVWLIQVFTYFRTQVRSPYKPGVLFAVVSHAYHMRMSRRFSYFKTMTLVLKDPIYRTICANDVVLGSRIILLTKKPEEPPRLWFYSAIWATFGACSVLIISTELTIQWNGIKGVQDLSSVGQLIPFILGVTGLLKVIYSAIMDRDEKEFCYYGHCSNQSKKKGKWKAVAEEFVACQKASERLDVVDIGEKPKAPAKDLVTTKFPASAKTNTVL